MLDDYQTELNLIGELFKISFLIGSVGSLQTKFSTNFHFFGFPDPKLFVAHFFGH